MTWCAQCGVRIQSGRLCQQCRLEEWYGDATDDRGRDPEGEGDE